MISRGETFVAVLALLAVLSCDPGGGGIDPATAPTAPPAPQSAPPPAPEPPSAPVVRVTAGQDFVEWNWDPVEGATSYEGHAHPHPLPPGQRPPLQDILEPTFRVDGLAPGETWDFSVRAVRETAGGRAVSPWAKNPSGRSLLATPVAVDLRPDGFFDQFAFNASDARDGTGRRWERLYLQTKRPRLGTVSPRFSPEFRAHIEATFDDLVEAFTGGLLPEGGPLIDVLTFHPSEGVPESCVGWCGCASSPGVYIDEGGTIDLTSRIPDSPQNGQPCGCGKADIAGCGRTWAHELAHIMGFGHVYQGSFDSTLGRGSTEPTPLDRIHGELAYCLGNGTPRTEALDPTTQAHCYLGMSN